MNEPIGMALLFCFCCSHFLPTPHVVDCDSFVFPRLELKTWASGWKPLTFHFLTDPLIFPIFSLHRFPAIFWAVSVWHMILPEKWFSSKINCQERTVPLRQLNFWHSKYQSGFLAILLFSCGVSFNKIVSVQQFFGDKVVSGRSRPFKAICLG